MVKNKSKRYFIIYHIVGPPPPLIKGEGGEDLPKIQSPGGVWVEVEVGGGGATFLLLDSSIRFTV